MARRNFTPEQIITHLRQVEILVGQGKTVGDACRQISVPEQTYFRWRREYGGMEVEQLRRLKELETENSRLNGLTIVGQIPFIKTLELASQECSYPIVMVDAYWAREEVKHVEPSYYMNDGDDIMCTALGWCTFKHGWGDCIIECPFAHYWQFRVVDNVATLVSESGAALSVESITFGAVKAQFR